MKYQIICADPPWGFDDGLKKMKRDVKRSAESHYHTMTVKQVCDLPVKQLIDPTGSLLALWVPGSMLQDGLNVMNAWGFTLKQTWVWVKLKKDYAKEADLNNSTRVGMGRLFRQTHEIALIGTAGKSIYPLLQNKSQRSVGFDLNEGHSIKPGTLQDRLEIMFPTANKIELFARRTRPNWTCLGDGIDGLDINNSLQTQIVL